MKTEFPNGIVIHEPCNVYPTAELGANVSVGMFSEIGPGVVVGDRTRIGAHSFIPEGCLIGDDCFIGPRTTMTNDNFPPSPKDQWESTVIDDGARIGAGCTILPGVVIGKRALIGAGSVVTKSVPDGEVWAGNPARKMVKK